MIARLLQRLRNRATWLRFTYPFQFAHGPLCDRYRDGALRFGHVFVCRSCLALYTTLVLSVPLLLWWSPPGQAWIWLLPSVAFVVLVASWPSLYRKLPRVARDVARAGAGALAGMVLVALLSGAWLAGGIAAVVLLGAYLAFARVRRAQRATLCDGCPELGRGVVCSGYTRQVKHLDRYEEVMAARCAPTLAAAFAARGTSDAEQ